VHKVLEGANRKLASVATDIMGVSGRAILAALLAGETDPVVLAELAKGPLRKKRPQLEQASSAPQVGAAEAIWRSLSGGAQSSPPERTGLPAPCSVSKEMHFSWNGGGWGRWNYQYAHSCSGVSFIYATC